MITFEEINVILSILNLGILLWIVNLLLEGEKNE